jgi:hypothetical protein
MAVTLRNSNLMLKLQVRLLGLAPERWRKLAALLWHAMGVSGSPEQQEVF